VDQSVAISRLFLIKLDAGGALGVPELRYPQFVSDFNGFSSGVAVPKS